MKLNIVFINDVHGYLAPHSELFYKKSILQSRQITDLKIN